MCAINPKFAQQVTFKVYTSDPDTTEEEFMNLVVEKSLEAEIKLNEDGRLRWHVQESEPIL